MQTKPFTAASAAIADDLKTELRLQGHYLTGDLERSLQDYVAHDGNTYHLTADALDYLETLETGIPAAQIRGDAATLAGLTTYVTARFGYRGGKAVTVAAAILRKQQKEGNPTRNSFQFSQTGKRTEAVSDTFEKNDNRYYNMIDNDIKAGADAILGQIKPGKV